MSKLHDILAFRNVAELGSFTAAARNIGASPSSITKSITRLESSLGIQLLHRTTRSVNLTEAGSLYLQTCEHVLDELEAAESRLHEASHHVFGHVRVCVPPSFGRLTLIPVLDRFFALYPEVQLTVHMKAATANPIEGNYDLTVHSGRLSDSRLVNRLLVRGPQKTVASPEFLERWGTPRVPEDLAGMKCIVGGFGPNWTFCGGREGKLTLRVSGDFITDSGDAIRESAVAGLGVAQATWWLFKEDIKAGRLVPLLQEFDCEAEPILIVMPAARTRPPKVRAFSDFIVELCRDV